MFQPELLFLSYIFQGPAPLIEDPINPGNNVSKSAFQFDKIKEIFKTTYNLAFIGCFCACHEKASAESQLQAQGSYNLLNQRMENISTPYLNQADQVHHIQKLVNAPTFLPG